MSVPFCNTHLRVPRGFGTILEGLAREVLRDQPEDIPKYAAHYFDALLKQREDSGMDPAEWAAQLEDMHNSNAFKATGASPEKEPATEVTISKEKSYEYKTEDESSYSTETTTQPNVSEEVDLTASTEEYEEKHDITEKHIISLETGIAEEQTVNMLPVVDVQPDDLSRAREEKDPTTTTSDQVDKAANGKDSSSASNQDMPQSEVEPSDLLSFRVTENVDVCAQELGTAEDEEGVDQQETPVIDQEMIDTEGVKKNDNEEQEQAFPYSGLADVDVCATELGETESTIERATAEDDNDSLKPEPEETVEYNQHEAKDQVEKTKEEEATEIEASSGGINESLAHIEGGLDSNVVPKEDSLVEISFEDVPQDQQIKEVEEKQPEDEGSVEVLQTNILEIQQEEDSKEVTVVATDQNISSTQDQDQDNLEMMGVEKAVTSEGGEMESEAFHTMNEKVESNDYDLNESDDDEKRKGVKTISSSNQPATKADEENPGDEDDQNEQNEKKREGELAQNEDSEEEAKSNNPDYKEDETTDTVGGDKGDIHTEDCSEVDDHLSQVTRSNVSTAATENETLEASAQHLIEENEEGQRTPVESQLEDAVEEKEVTSTLRSSEAEDLEEEGKIDSEIQKKSDAMCEEGSVSPTESADRLAAGHQGEERPLEKDSTEPDGKIADKEECSRPQEEEDIMDIPLDDPEANRAAAKIQAGFRGHMTRKKMKPEDKAEGEEVSSTGDVLNGSKGDTETGGSGAVERDDTSVPEQ